jgi:DNA adenine methylase
MAESNSPLRYPGGKAVLSDFLAEVIETNGINECIYAEPYAGGAGAALNLLLSGKVERILLNDADKCVWSFWRAVLDHTDAFIERIRQTPITVDEWHRQRAIHTQHNRGILDLGFATFFLNRCNRSGIITRGGIIGGVEQTGEWKIDARFNREGLVRRIERIAAYREQIEVFNLDAIEFVRNQVLTANDRSRYFIYFDPPYYVQGSRLYLNYYKPEDHQQLATYLSRIRNVHWLVTYDNVPETRALYARFRTVDFSLRYSAHSAREGKEIMVYGPTLATPSDESALDVG